MTKPTAKAEHAFLGPGVAEDPPLAIMDQHVAILGKTGAGKTVLAKKLAEMLADAGRRFGAIDPLGAWWGLRLTASGKRAAIPVVIFGGPHADVHIDARLHQTGRYDARATGERVAKAVAEGSFSFIIDTSEMKTDQRTQFFIGFAEQIIVSNRRALNLFIDECHLFMAQQKDPGFASATMTSAANAMVSGGRGRGLRITMISQRAAKVHKDSLTQVETMCAMRVVAPQDIDTVEDWIGKRTRDKESGKAIIASIPSLPTGTAFVWAPEIDFLKKLKIPMIRTFDSSRAPEHGEEDRNPVALSSVDIDAIRSLIVPPEQKVVAKSDTKAHVAAKPTTATVGQPTISEKEIARREDAAFQRGRDSGWKEAVESFEAKVWNPICDTQHKIADDYRRLMSTFPRAPGKKVRDEARPAPVAIIRSDGKRYEKPIARSESSGDGSLSKGIRKILIALAQEPEGLDKSALVIMTGYTRSSVETYAQKSEVLGLSSKRGDLRFVTHEGISALGNFERLPEGSALRDYWLAKLPKGEAVVLGVAITNYPNGASVQTVVDETRYTASSVETYIQKLKARRLLDDVRGFAKASDKLFD